MSMKRIIMHIDVNNAFLSWTAVLYLKQGNKVDIRKTYAVMAKQSRLIGGRKKLAKIIQQDRAGGSEEESLLELKSNCAI